MATLTVALSSPVEKAYLFTYSPKGTTITPVFTYADHIFDYFQAWNRCMKEFEVNPELNVNGNLHYHGYFVLKDSLKWFKSVLPKMKKNGFIKINEVKHNLTEGLIYSRKDRELMLQILKGENVPYTHLIHKIKKPKPIEGIGKYLD